MLLGYAYPSSILATERKVERSLQQLTSLKRLGMHRARKFRSPCLPEIVTGA